MLGKNTFSNDPLHLQKLTMYKIFPSMNGHIYSTQITLQKNKPICLPLNIDKDPSCQGRKLVISRSSS